MFDTWVSILNIITLFPSCKIWVAQKTKFLGQDMLMSSSKWSF